MGPGSDGGDRGQSPRSLAFLATPPGLGFQSSALIYALICGPQASEVEGGPGEARETADSMASGTRYAGKVVVVTGGGRGIGAGIVRAFGEQGSAAGYFAG